jgi:outer membrane receptor for ferrienterochelin and colicin
VQGGVAARSRCHQHALRWRLRGLGPQRTLVLANSRRLGPGDANTANPNPGVDVIQIPAQLIDRIEVCGR